MVVTIKKIIIDDYDALASDKLIPLNNNSLSMKKIWKKFAIIHERIFVKNLCKKRHSNFIF